MTPLHWINTYFCLLLPRLVPIPQDTWMEEGVRDVLMPGDLVEVRIHKVSEPVRLQSHRTGFDKVRFELATRRGQACLEGHS